MMKKTKGPSAAKINKEPWSLFKDFPKEKISSFFIPPTPPRVIIWPFIYDNYNFFLNTKFLFTSPGKNFTDFDDFVSCNRYNLLNFNFLTYGKSGLIGFTQKYAY